MKNMFERLAVLNIAKLDLTSLFKQNVSLEQVAGEGHRQVPAASPPASSLSLSLPLGIQRSWPRDSFVVTRVQSKGLALHKCVY